MSDSIRIRPDDQIANCRWCGSRNMTMHQGWADMRWGYWFHCNACGYDTPRRELRDDAFADVLWVPFIREVQAP